jgi:hypothetical protein
MKLLIFAGIIMMAAIALKIGFVIYRQITANKVKKTKSSYFGDGL